MSISPLQTSYIWLTDINAEPKIRYVFWRIGKTVNTRPIKVIVEFLLPSRVASIIICRKVFGSKTENLESAVSTGKDGL